MDLDFDIDLIPFWHDAFDPVSWWNEPTIEYTPSEEMLAQCREP